MKFQLEDFKKKVVVRSIIIFQLICQCRSVNFFSEFFPFVTGF